jgi:signal transduction histidine kinase
LEQERKRIAHDLHDEVGPLVSLTQMQLSIALERADGPKHIDHAQKHLQEVMRRMGAIAINLTPKALEERGLVFALDQYLQTVAEASCLNIETDFRVDQHIEPSTGIHVYRMVQEIVHNTIKHAHAHRLDIMMHSEKRMLYLRTKDDGCGFAFNDVTRGTGLSSIKSRADLLGGTIKCETEPGKGTEYLLTIPIIL